MTKAGVFIGLGLFGYWVASMLVKKQHQPPKSPSLNFYPEGNRLNIALSF